VTWWEVRQPGIEHVAAGLFFYGFLSAMNRRNGV